MKMVQITARIPFIDDFYVESRDKGDYLRAFNDAQQSLPEAGNVYSVERGATLAFRPVLYNFSDTLHLLKPMHLMGAGAGYNNGTMLEFPPGKKGIIVHGVNTSRYTEFGGNENMPHSAAQSSIIERLLITTPSSGRVPITEFNESYVTPFAGAHGLTAYATCHIRDVSIQGFSGHGIYLFGFNINQVTQPEIDPATGLEIKTATGVAMSVFSNITVNSCAGDGVHIMGEDASNMLFTCCTFNHCGGYGICDKSHLGCNTFIGGQASYNALGPLQRPREVPASDYESLARRLRYDINLDPANALNIGYLAMEAVLLRLGEAGIRRLLYIDSSLFSGINKIYSDIDYVADYLSFVISKFIKRKEIIERLYAVVSPKENYRASIELEHASVYALGSDVFLNFYSEGPYNWTFYFDVALEKAYLIVFGRPVPTTEPELSELEALKREVKLHLSASQFNIAIGSPQIASAGTSGFDADGDGLRFYKAINVVPPVP
jgi:Right handed beta helix region